MSSNPDDNYVTRKDLRLLREELHEEINRAIEEMSQIFKERVNQVTGRLDRIEDKLDYKLAIVDMRAVDIRQLK